MWLEIALFVSIPLRFAVFDLKIYNYGSIELEHFLKSLQYSYLLTLFNSTIKSVSYHLMHYDTALIEAVNLCVLLLPHF